jgi:hypothetical protein
MKYLLTIIILSVFIFAGCNGSDNSQITKVQEEKMTPVSTPSDKPAETEKEGVECKICDFDYENYKGELNKEEIKGLLLALNDEYMASATYQQINKDFNDPRPFINIHKAENRHADRLKELFNTYQIAVPQNDWIGKTEKYQSVKEACEAGIKAEIANRDLYKQLFDSTKRQDILFVYNNLQRASAENHLPAFQRCVERGGGGEGRGYGNGRGRGNN